ncbi:hypothetical protein CABS01_16200 [Colletotrichum abscissum]|uniref:uncharacterized protein n=1 Tax=Colletotrichum abscissum TaxID=1671311 RepID=UPI0027D4E4B5|nr:uncharacterized protein CABS01_16200 [Colletotrichum abscissum]KAK1472734.1 hypothetical protein CABS01_16200 [Colletotrichum abscissum]
MVNIAIAGGTGGVGRSIVDALRNDPRHSTIILSRTEAAEDKAGVPVVAVDYDDRTSLQTTLETHEIHTVISALALHIIGVGQAQINLIQAADKSNYVAKFVVEALDLATWEHDTYLIGDEMTWEEFIAIAEEARGGKKFHVTYDSVQKLQSGEITELPGQVAAYSYFPKQWAQQLFSTFGFWVTEGLFDFPKDRALNQSSASGPASNGRM